MRRKVLLLTDSVVRGELVSHIQPVLGGLEQKENPPRLTGLRLHLLFTAVHAIACSSAVALSSASPTALSRATEGRPEEIVD